MLLKTEPKEYYISSSNPFAFKFFSDKLFQMLYFPVKENRDTIIFLCIGTDRSTGDSLGPIIGYKIQHLKYSDVKIYGTLENPVHAKNLDGILYGIYHTYSNPFIVAIDASLGNIEHIGYITIGNGTIKPGSGVNKELAPTGDIFITGIVNFSGFMDYLILQNTRLSIVMKMADIISMGIKHVLWKLKIDNFSID